MLCIKETLRLQSRAAGSPVVPQDCCKWGHPCLATAGGIWMSPPGGLVTSRLQLVTLGDADGQNKLFARHEREVLGACKAPPVFCVLWSAISWLDTN